MSDSNKSVPFYVVNNTGRTMPTLWVNHNASDNPLQTYMLTNVSSGTQQQSLGSLEIVSRTDDYFTALWTDPSNNLYGTPYQYKTETSMDGGYVVLQIENSTFQFIQNDEGPLDDPENYIQYEVAPAS